MAMNPRTHPRGARPDFALPKPNPNPARMTDALWWFVCMCEALEPASQNGGTFANKAGYHNAGENLPDHGAGNSRTDHSIRRAPDRRGPWWREKTAGRDWTFPDAQRGEYKTIIKYTKRMVNAMRDPDDLRPDDVFAYVLGQIDGDTVVEGYNEYTDDPETSADKTHLWHIHESWRRDIVGNFWAMWKALTIYMGWTYAEWLASTAPEKPQTNERWSEMATREEVKDACREALSEFLWDAYNASKQTETYLKAPAADQKRMRNARDTFAAVAADDLIGAVDRIDKTVKDLAVLIVNRTPVPEK